MTSPEPLQALEQALATAEAALAAGDAEAARLAAEAGAAACHALDEGPHHPTGAQLAALVAAHARVLARAEATHGELARALEQTGRSRRASSAYGRR